MSRVEEREAALLDLVRRAAALALGGESVEAYAVHSVGTSISVFDREVERLTSAESRGVGVRVIEGGRLGFAATSDVTDAGLVDVVAEARSNAEYGTPDVGNVLPAPAPDGGPIPGLVDPALLDVPTTRKVRAALEIERLATSIDSRVGRVERAAYGDAVTSVALASTAGLALSYSRTDAYAYASALARAGEETQTAFGFTEARGFDDLELEAAAREAVERSVRLLGARKPATATVPVVFDPFVTAEFLGVVGGMLSAEAVQKGRSLFAGRVGERVAGDAVTLVDDGRLPEGPAAAPFDDEGVPTGRTTLLTGGVLTGFLHDTETAARDGGSARSTGNAARGGYGTTPGVAATNMFLDLVPGTGVAPAEVIARAGTGLYVQQVSGMHSGVNPISGEFSVGATGLWIRDGALAEPVREMTVSATILDMLAALSLIGNDRRFFPGAGASAGATVLIDRMTVAGT